MRSRAKMLCCVFGGFSTTSFFQPQRLDLRLFSMHKTRGIIFFLSFFFVEQVRIDYIKRML